MPHHAYQVIIQYDKFYCRTIFPDFLEVIVLNVHRMIVSAFSHLKHLLITDIVVKLSLFNIRQGSTIYKT